MPNKHNLLLRNILATQFSINLLIKNKNYFSSSLIQVKKILEIFMTKELVISTINELDEPFSFDDFLDKLLFIEKVEKGLKQSENGNTISDDELDLRVQQWSA